MRSLGVKQTEMQYIIRSFKGTVRGALKCLMQVIKIISNEIMAEKKARHFSAAFSYNIIGMI